MRYMMIYSTDRADSPEPPTEEEQQAMGQLIGEMAAAGVLLLTDGLMPSSTGARVRRQDGKVTVKDGPFSESKELVGGFAIMKADSKEHAIELAKKFLAVAGDGEVEIRQMYDEPAFVSPEVHPTA